MFTDKVYCLDGGFTTELERELGDSFTGVEMWGSSVLVNKPEVVIPSHTRFIAAGADVVETDTYHSCVRTLRAKGIDAKQVIANGVQMVRAAIKGYNIDRPVKEQRDVKVAGAIGPYSCIFEHQIRDGSKPKHNEYGGEYVKDCDFEDMVLYHVEQGSLLVESGCDLLAYETIPAAREGQAVLKALDKLPEHTKAWVAFSCKSATETCFGDNAAQAIDACLEHPKVVAAGVNCCNPAFVSPILNNVINKHNKPLVVYPNSGEMYSYINGWSGAGEKAASWAHHVDEWTTLGAKLIGGCCRVYSDDINTISKKINMINNSKK